MKTKNIFITIALTFLLFFAIIPVFGTSTGPGDPGSDPQLGGDPPLGGGAPIDGGVGFLLVMGAAYGSKKLYKHYKAVDENDEENR